MDSFEIKTDNFDPSRLRESAPRRDDNNSHIPLTDIEKAALMADDTPRLRPDIEDDPMRAVHHGAASSSGRQQERVTETSENRHASETSSKRSQATQRQSQKERKQQSDHVAVNLDEHKTIVGLTQFFTDGRLRTFIGVALILFAGLLLVASISYISTASADQSIIINSSQSQIAANHEGVTNSVGWFGALLSHLLIYRWLGLGAFIVIFYIGALGISLVRLHHFRFWHLTLKSLVASIAVSIILGFVTYGVTTDTFWGGEHGFWINNIVISASSYWGGGALSILMATALVLIFIGPIKSAARSLRKMIARRKQQLSTRYRESMAAAKAAMQQEKENRTSTSARAEKEAID